MRSTTPVSNGKDPSSGGIHKCVKYDDNGVWVCNEHGQEESYEEEEEIEKAMLRGEVVFKEE